MLNKVTPAQLTLIKWAAIGIAGYWAYKKITGIGAKAVAVAEDVVTVKLNPMHRDNLAHQAAENIIGAEALANGSTRFFDWIDTAAEFVGIENGINGIPGTTADATRRIALPAPVIKVEKPLNPAPFIVAPETELQASIREAGNQSTAQYGANANG